MDGTTAGLVGQLVAVIGLVVLVLLGPPESRQAIRIRDDGHTEYVDDDSGPTLWHFLARVLVALFACSTLLGITDLARG